MVQYLREHEVKDEQIMLEDQSRTTRENLRFSKAYLDGALEQIVGDAARVFERSRYQFLGRGDRLFTVGRRRADKYIESYHSRYVFEFCTNSL